MMKIVFFITVITVKFLIKAVDSREFILKLFPTHSQNVQLKEKQDQLNPYKYDIVRVIKTENKPLESSTSALSKQIFNKEKLNSKLPVFVYLSGNKNDRRIKKANKKHKMKYKNLIEKKNSKKNNRARHIQTNKQSGHEIAKNSDSLLKEKKNKLSNSHSFSQPFNLQAKIPKSSSEDAGIHADKSTDNDTKDESNPESDSNENDVLEIGDNNLIMKLLKISKKRKKRKLMNLIYNISKRRERLIDNDLESDSGNTDFDEILRLLRDQLRKYYINVYSDDPNNKQILILEKQNPKYKDVYDLHSGIVLSSDDKIFESDDNTFQNLPQQQLIDALDEDDYIVADGHYDNESPKDTKENMKILEELKEIKDDKSNNRNTKRNEYATERKLDKELHEIADLLSQIIIMDTKTHEGQNGQCSESNNGLVENAEKTIHDLEHVKFNYNADPKTAVECSDENLKIEEKICELCADKRKIRTKANCGNEKDSLKPKADNGYENFNAHDSNLEKFATNYAVANLQRPDVADAENAYSDRVVQENRHTSSQSAVNEYDNQPVHRDDKSLLNYDTDSDDDDDYVDKNQAIHDTRNVRWNCRNDDKNYNDIYDDTENLYEENVKRKRSAQEFLDEINAKAEKANQKDVIAQWQYETNITEETHAKAIASAEYISEVEMSIWKQIKQFIRENSDYLGNYPQISRQFKLWSVLGEMALPKSKYVKLQEIVAYMTTVYSTTTVCEFQDPSNCGVPLEPDLENIMAHSRNPDELLHYWISWHNKTGQPMKKNFNTYVDLLNEAAVLNNFSNAAAMWLDVYEDPEIEDKAAELWFEIQPLYLQLHTYVRRKLTEYYGTAFVHKDGVIPAHLLGNMWAQTWINIYDITKPFPNTTKDDVTAAFMDKVALAQLQTFVGKKRIHITSASLLENIQTDWYELGTPIGTFSSPKCMFIEADKFFQSLGFKPLPSLFWEKSVIDPPPKGVKMVCHGSAWDMHNRKDFRIKMCTHIRMEDFVTIHHEMGHIQYYISYKNQPYTFREGANPGFHEAIGDVIALSVMTPSHLKKIGLLKKEKIKHDDAATEINFLYQMALEKITFLPFAYALDLWRWDVFRKKIHPDHYNKHFWNLRELYQGLQAPVHRTEEYFDPGAKYHIAANVPYFRYFLSFIMQFQFHKALCKEAKKYNPHNLTKPLHSCDIYKNKNAGKLLRKMLSLGSSKPWPQAMKVMTGNDEIDPKPLLEYFKPLQDWLEDENSSRNEKIGWSKMLTRKKKYSFQKI